jgi:hypothetical protein
MSTFANAAGAMSVCLPRWIALFGPIAPMSGIWMSAFDSYSAQK